MTFENDPMSDFMACSVASGFMSLLITIMLDDAFSKKSAADVYERNREFFLQKIQLR